MPVILFSESELFEAAVARMRSASSEILGLSDLEAKPLDPGESPNDRRHKIAKLGKQLAEAFAACDQLMAAIASRLHDAQPSSPPAPTDTTN